MISIGNEIRIMRQDNAAMVREADVLHQLTSRESSKSKICWTQCKSPTQNCTQIGEILSQKMLLSLKNVSIREMRCYKSIIEKSTLLSQRSTL